MQWHRRLRNTHLKNLFRKSQKLLHIGLAKSSSNTYAAGWRRYLNFCWMARIKPIPTSEGALTLFVTHLAISNISQGTIKVYLSAVRHMHTCKGLHDHFNHQITPRLQLKGELKSTKQACTLPKLAYRSLSSCFTASKPFYPRRPPLTATPHFGLCTVWPFLAS